MIFSHVHCRVKDLVGAVEWFESRCGVVPSFTDARMAVLLFGAFTLILDAASEDSVATIGFHSVDCDVDFAALVARGARALQPPQDRPYGARVAYLQGPGALTIEMEQATKQTTQLHEDKFLNVFWDEKTRIIGIDWKETTSSMTDEEFKSELTLFAGQVEQKKARGILVDVSRFRHRPAPDVQPWQIRNISNRYSGQV